MPSGYNLGRAYLTVVPTMQGSVKTIARDLEGVGVDAGRSFSRALSRSIGGQKVDTGAIQRSLDDAKRAAERAADAMAAADKRVEKSAADMAKARKDAADKIAIAELKVSEVREKSIAKDKQVIAAERDLAAARKGQDTQAIATAEQRLADARSKAGVTSADLSAEKSLADARERYGRVSREGVSTIQRYAQEQKSARVELERTTGELKDAEAATERTGRSFGSLGDKIKNAFKGKFGNTFREVEGDGQRAAREIESDFDRAGRESGDSFSRGFKGAMAGLAATAGAYLGLDTLKDGIVSSVSGAADLEQSIGGVQTVFKGSADQMLAWSDTADSTLGMTANEYNEFSARLGASLKNAGTPMDQLAGKTNGLITMGADLASLYGGTTSEAVDALSAALRGEMDPIERYGISLNDAALTQEGLAMGIKKTGGSFTNQQKQLIVMSLLQKQSADATGNFAREQDTASNVMQRLTAKIKEMGTSFGQKLIPMLAAAGSWLIDKGIPAFESFGSSMGNVFELLKTGDFKGGIFGLSEDSPVIGALFDVRDAALALWDGALKPLIDGMSANAGVITSVLGGAVNAIAELVSGVAGTIQWIVANQDWIVPLVAGVTAMVAAWKAWTIAIAIWKGLQAAAIALQTAFNAVMDANPIGLIVLAIIGLIAAFVVAYQKSEWFRGVVDAVWAGIKSAIGAVVDWIVTVAWPMIQTAWNAIAAAAVWLWQNALVPAWNGIMAAISVVGTWITGTLVPWLQTAWSAIASAATWLWQSVIQPVWTGIKVAIAVAVAIVMTLVQAWVWFFQNVVAPVFTWLWNSVIVPAWNGIKGAIDAVVQWFQNTAWPLAKTVIDFFAGGFNLLWEIVKLVWAWIRSAINAVVGWFRDTAWPIAKAVIDFFMGGFKLLWEIVKSVWAWIKSAIDAVVVWFQTVAWPIAKAVIDFFAGGFKLLWSIVKSVWQGIKDAINAVVGWFRDTAWPVISGVIDSIKRGFDVMRSAIGDAWSWIKDKAINPVASWFRDTVKPLFDTATDGISSAFDTLKSAVEKAWNGIRDTAKVPVEFVVNKIINDAIIGNYNSVAKTFGIGEIAKVGLPSGWARGGILPGFRPIHQGDDVLTPMRSGEGVLVSEGLRDRESRSAFLGANAAAKRGMSFAQYMRAASGYAGGGIVEIKKIAQDLGLRLTSSSRPGARTAQTGSVSLHALGKAWDFAGPASAMMAFFNKVDSTFSGLTELLYSPAGNRNIHRGGKRGPNTGATLRGHYNHVHVGIMDELSAGGGGGGGFSLNPFEGLWDSLKDKVREGVGTSAFGDMLFNLPKKLIDAGIDKVTGFLGDGVEMVQGVGSDIVGGTRWTPVATQALAHEGIYNPFTLASLMRRMEQESNFNPRAINNWDSNAKKGTPSKGLMQVIQPTFNRYRAKDLSSDIWDPMANIVASIRYATARYGDPRKGWDRKGGYALGGIVGPDFGSVMRKHLMYDSGGILKPGMTSVMNKTGRPEAILTQPQWRDVSKAVNYVTNQQTTGGLTIGSVYGHSAQDVAREITKAERKREALRTGV